MKNKFKRDSCFQLKYALVEYIIQTVLPDLCKETSNIHKIVGK